MSIEPCYYTDIPTTLDIDPWAALNALPDGLVILDEQGIICFLNGTWKNQFSYNANKFAVGKDFMTCFTAAVAGCPVDVRALASSLNTVLTGTVTNCTFSYVAPRCSASFEQTAHSLTMMPHMVDGKRGVLLYQRRLNVENSTTPEEYRRPPVTSMYPPRPAPLAQDAPQMIDWNAPPAFDHPAIDEMLHDNAQAIKLIIEPQTGAIVDANEAACHFYNSTHDTLLALRLSDLQILPADHINDLTRRAATEWCPSVHLTSSPSTDRQTRLDIHAIWTQLHGHGLILCVMHAHRSQSEEQTA